MSLSGSQKQLEIKVSQLRKLADMDVITCSKRISGTAVLNSNAGKWGLAQPKQALEPRPQPDRDIHIDNTVNVNNNPCILLNIAHLTCGTGACYGGRVRARPTTFSLCLALAPSVQSSRTTTWSAQTQGPERPRLRTGTRPKSNRPWKPSRICISVFVNCAPLFPECRKIWVGLWQTVHQSRILITYGLIADP